MPILSVYFGSKIVSAAVIPDRGQIITSKFEYTYSPYLYGHFYSEEAFNTDLVDYFLKALKLKKSNTKIIVTGLFESPKLNLPVEYSSKIGDLLKDITNTFPVMANYQSILTKQEVVYSQKMHKNNSPMTDISSNMDIYNFSDLSFQVSHSIVQSQTLDLHQAAQADSITIFGELLTNILGSEKSLVYKLLLDLVIPIGVYKIFFDDNLLYVHQQLLKSSGLNYDPQVFNNTVVELCTLVNVPGSTSCLLESNVGTNQLININENDVFIEPLPAEASLKILLKNQQIGTREFKVSGGKLGLIVDTRDKSNPDFDSDILNGNLIRKLDEAVVNLVE